MKTLTCIGVCIGIFSVGTAKADDFSDHGQPSAQKETYFGGLAGEIIGTSGGAGNSFTFSGRMGTGLFADKSGILSLGIMVNYSQRTIRLGTITASGGYTAFLAELLTRRAFGTGLYLGARIGAAVNNIDLTSTQSSASLSTTATSFVVGPVLGYEFPLAGVLNFDLDASWMGMGGTTYNFPGVGSVQTNSATAFLIQGGLTLNW